MNLKWSFWFQNGTLGPFRNVLVNIVPENQICKIIQFIDSIETVLLKYKMSNVTLKQIRKISAKLSNVIPKWSINCTTRFNEYFKIMLKLISILHKTFTIFFPVFRSARWILYLINEIQCYVPPILSAVFSSTQLPRCLFVYTSSAVYIENCADLSSVVGPASLSRRPNICTQFILNSILLCLLENSIYLLCMILINLNIDKSVV